MIELGLLSSVSFLGAVLVASLAGAGIASRARWLEAEIGSGFRLIAGLSLGPFLLGLATVLILVLAPGASHQLHFWTALGLLAPFALMGVRPAFADSKVFLNSARSAPWSFAASVIVTLLLIFIATFTPLTQNDALEYAMVVDRIFDLRSLASYPMLHPETEPSGFYAPWTHPPLFPALLYFAKLANPLAQMPSVERLIGPWALILCGLTSASLAQLCGFKSTQLAFVAVVTAPLAMLGAANGLVDSLAMLGFAIPMCLIAAGVRSGQRLALLTGFAVGMGAWTHSQGILLFPLAIGLIPLRDKLLTGVMRWKDAGVALIASLAAGVWPYIWNVQNFGVPVSDDQAFSSTLLEDWAGYFAMDRGLGSWPAQVTYGMLKMFTAPEAFGPVFVFAALTALALLLRRLKAVRQTGGKPSGETQTLIALMPVLFIALYLLGVLASLLAGQITLIKNERYFLVMLPAAAALAAGLPDVIENVWKGRTDGFFAKSLSSLVHPALMALFLAQACFLTAYTLNRNFILTRGLGQPFEKTLRGRGEFALAYFLRDRSPPNSIVLSLKPADMFYTKRRMVSQFDPRLAAFYASRDPQAALNELRKLGVSFVHLPSYAMPTYYNSALKQIVSDPARATLRFENNEGQIFELVPAKGKVVAQLDARPGRWPWEKADGVVFGSRKRIGQLTSGYQPVSGTQFISNSIANRILPRHFSAVFRMGEGGIPAFADTAPGDEVTARFLLSGECHIMIHAIERSEQGAIPADARLIATAIVEPRTSPLDLPVRFKSGAFGVAMSLTASGVCNLDVKDVELSIFSPDKATGLGLE
jgi:hypothetical protein